MKQLVQTSVNKFNYSGQPFYELIFTTSEPDYEYDKKLKIQKVEKLESFRVGIGQSAFEAMIVHLIEYSKAEIEENK